MSATRAPLFSETAGHLVWFGQAVAGARWLVDREAQARRPPEPRSVLGLCAAALMRLGRRQWSDVIDAKLRSTPEDLGGFHVSVVAGRDGVRVVPVGELDLATVDTLSRLPVDASSGGC